jgi:branched-subunit amino acid aminotransferase/4-amino-4-deoxychorismate lyase
MFFAQLDPLLVVEGTLNDRYGCPDVATLDRHIERLRRHIAAISAEAPLTADAYRTTIDRLLDRRAWLTLPLTETPG